MKITGIVQNDKIFYKIYTKKFFKNVFIAIRVNANKNNKYSN